VIRATSINHGGKTNGYTVQIGCAEGAGACGACEAQISARSVSYIEAHGRDGAWGPDRDQRPDAAFAQDTQERQFCAIGLRSRTSGTSRRRRGIAGLSKVVLQLKHGELGELHAASSIAH